MQFWGDFNSASFQSIALVPSRTMIHILFRLEQVHMETWVSYCVIQHSL